MVFYDPVGVVLGDSQAIVTVVDDDLPIVTVADQRVSEGGDFVEFELELHAPGVEGSSVEYATRVTRTGSSAAAEPGVDYTHTTGKVTFAASEVRATVRVPIIADVADEPDEVFLLELSGPVGLELGDAVAVGTIVDDDDGWWVEDRSVWENAATMVFTVQRDHTSAQAVTVNYRIGTAGSAAGGSSCIAGVDYVTPSGVVIMAAADTEVEISVEICNDTDIEGSESLQLELTNLTGRKTTATGTIVDDD